MQSLLERNVILLIIATLITVSIGGLVELIPLFTIKNTVEKVVGMRPYSPLELEGENIYVANGCYLCHSQMIRSLRAEVERYGHYSLAAESMYDHPFQWGSERTGPDLARVGGKYPNSWQVAHLIDPRSVVPESIMPDFAFLARTPLNFNDIAANMKTLRIVGVPYTNADIANAKADLIAQADPDNHDPSAMQARYPKAVAADFDGNPKVITKMDALVAYLQMLGTLVDTKDYQLSPEGR